MMKPLRAAAMIRVVGAAGRALSAALDTRHKPIVSEMLNSAGSVSAEWYVEVLWHYLHKRALLQGVSGFDVEFAHPAKLTDKQVLFALPHPEANDLVMDFHVVRPVEGSKVTRKVPVAHIQVHRGQRRRRHGLAPDPPFHPYGIEIRQRNLNSEKKVSWYTLVSVTMDVARRGAQFADLQNERLESDLLYIVPRFSFTPLADAAAQQNLFVYPDFKLERPWVRGKTSATALVTYWAVANESPWPIAETVVTVVRSALIDGVRRAVDERGEPARKGDSSPR